MAAMGRRHRMRRGTRIWLGSAAFAILFLLVAAPAGAVDIIEKELPETKDSGWQAGTCTTDVPQCVPEEPKQFFTQAAGHPPVGFTQIIVKHNSSNEPAGELKTVLVDLPKGLSVDHEATPKCKLEEGHFPAAGCEVTAKGSEVGYSLVTAFVPIVGVVGPLKFPVYNIEPRPGEPA